MRIVFPGSATRWWGFEDPDEILEAWTPDEVLPICRRAERATEEGRWVGGFLLYEAASGFDPLLSTQPSRQDLPLVRFAVYRQPRLIIPPRPVGLPPLDWKPALDEGTHAAAVEKIRAAIERGDTYQANWTFPLEAQLPDHGPSDWAAAFAGLWTRQRSRRAAFLEDDRHVLLSTSPELFLERRTTRVRSEPIKGTAPRGRFPAEDHARSRELAASSKERAENVMIVDMIRNDLGKVARPGTVRVPWHCRIESWATVHQLVSRVEAETDASWAELLRAVFPCASITGAPKQRTMEILAGLEVAPRGIYTGSIGWWGPGRRGRMNVAIRTLAVDKSERRATYGTGGGIVWDSRPASEWRECRTKTLILRDAPTDFRYLETMLWTPSRGWVALELHLRRLLASAERFGDRAVQRNKVLHHLQGLEAEFSGRRRQRVRLLVDRGGAIASQARPLEPPRPRPEWTVALDDRPVDSANLFLFHKTTQRDPYADARARHPEVDDVILWNERGELTETTIANLALLLDGRWWTPPSSAGLLGGTFRERLLRRGRIQERTLRPSDLARAEGLLLFNAVRGLRRGRLTERKAGPAEQSASP